MKVTVRNNDNSETMYMFEPNGMQRLVELYSYYAKQYMNLMIQGYQIEDQSGRVVKFGGSI